MSVILKEPKAKNCGKIMSLPVDWIFPNPAQPRRLFGQEELAELARSIEENGLLQPILVRKVSEKRFQLISGERRLMAVRSLDRKMIAAIIYDVESGESATMALVENIHRKNLSFFEEARAISNLINIWGITQEEAAKKLGRSQSAVANKLRLLRLSDEMRVKIEKNELTERHARALLAIEDYTLRREVLERIINQRLNVAQTEQYIKKLIEATGNGKNSSVASYLCVVKDVRLFVNTINKAVDTMLCSGINAESITNENEEFIEYIVKIPKTQVYKKKEEGKKKETIKAG
ncbi:MAG: ParB/RepB/Spo0J family partition protein [Ruminococcaceae bacterium]|nr:ParB/RepB/Spo0J family partition protein [Oscillospiraceae bacterium]